MGRVLLLTGATGGGHTQVANTLCTELQSHGHDVVISDLLVDFNKAIKFTCVDGYSFLYKKLPALYGLMYRFTDRKVVSKMTANVFHALIGKKIIKFISEVNPDIIISVHPFGSGLLGKLRYNKYIGQITVALITDFKAHWTHVGKGIDYYVVCSDYSKLSLVKKGVDSSTIGSMGIPIRSDFLNKNINQKDKGIFTVLVMGGSEGEKFIERSLFWIARNKDVRIIVVCGKNDLLRKRLASRYSKRNNVEIRGFEKNIPELMSKADIIITKPGAITVTEAISQELPIVIPYAIPGHESANAKFLVKSGIALRTHSYIWLAHIVEKLMKNPDMIDSIKGNIKENNVKYSTPELVDIIDDYCLKRRREAN